jgi:hypothetical protein
MKFDLSGTIGRIPKVLYNRNPFPFLENIRSFEIYNQGLFILIKLFNLPRAPERPARQHGCGLLAFFDEPERASPGKAAIVFF